MLNNFSKKRLCLFLFLCYTINNSRVSQVKLINRIKNNKLLYFLGVLIIGLLIILIVRITYAYLGASINEAKGNITLNSDDVDELKFDIGDPL